MIAAFLAAAGVLALLTITPGPDLAVVTRRALAGGFGDAVRATLGIAAGLLVWGTLTVAGLSALLTASPGAYLAVRVAGVAYLVVLGVQAFRSAARHGDAPPAAGHEPGGPAAPGGPGGPGAPSARPFLTGLTTNLLNPKIAVFYTALLPTLAPAGSGAGGLAALVVIHAALTLSWFTAYARTLDRAGAVLQRPRVRRALDRVTGAVLLAFALRLALERA